MKGIKKRGKEPSLLNCLVKEYIPKVRYLLWVWLKVVKSRYSAVTAENENLFFFGSLFKRIGYGCTGGEA